MSNCQRHGCTEGGDNTFTYETARHDIDWRVGRPSKGDDMFDDELENDLVAAVDESIDLLLRSQLVV